MNRALVGAMTGAAAGRGRHTVHADTLLGILRGWLIDPGAGVALAYGITRLVTVAIGAHTVHRRLTPAGQPSPADPGSFGYVCSGATAETARHQSDGDQCGVAVVTSGCQRPHE